LDLQHHLKPTHRHHFTILNSSHEILCEWAGCNCIVVMCICMIYIEDILSAFKMYTYVHRR
jgi:hypothetical protein